MFFINGFGAEVNALSFVCNNGAMNFIYLQYSVLRLLDKVELFLYSYISVSSCVDFLRKSDFLLLFLLYKNKCPEVGDETKKTSPEKDEVFVSFIRRELFSVSFNVVDTDILRGLFSVLTRTHGRAEF